MNLASRIYRLLRIKYPNEWVSEEDIIALAKDAGYRRDEVVRTLNNLSRGVEKSHTQMFVRKLIRSNKAKGIVGGVFYRWTEEDDYEKARLEGIKWFDEYPCGCGQQGCRHGR